ncbi:MAG: PaRep2b protein [Pyrobaculum sp.]
MSAGHNLFLMAAAAAGAITLVTALNLWGLVELEKLAHAASAPFMAGLADAGGRAAERFKTLTERYEKWKIDERLIDGVLKAPLRGERPYAAPLKLAESADLTKPLVELRRALKDVKDEVERDAAVVAALVLYKTLVKNAGAYREWAGWYKWARSLVGREEFTVAAGDIKRLRGAQRRLEEAAEEARRELNAVLALCALHGRDLCEKLKPHLEVDVEKAEELAEARRVELSRYSNANMGTKVYAALLSVARGGIYGHTAMLLMAEGALADVALLTPRSAYEKADRVAEKHGVTVDPSRSPKGAVDWEDRAASVLLRFLIGYGEADLKFRHVEKRGKKGRVERGFQVSRTFGGIEAPVGELWIGEVAYFNVSEEELRRRVEEAMRVAPDLSGMDTSSQYLEWRATDVSTSWRQIVAGTVHSWQLRWYFGLLGKPNSFSGKAIVTREGFKLAVIAYWSREREDEILRGSSWLKSLLGHTVNNWRELVDAIDWNWVLKKVEELADELKTWIGPEGMSDVEREELVRRMLGELALLVRFAEARRGKNDGDWHEERIKMLAKAVEDLSCGRIAGDFAKELARLIIYYAEGRKQYAEKHINKLAEKLVGVSNKEVWGIVRRVLSSEDPNVYCLARDCARDAVVRKFVAPALELIMLDKALRGEFDRERALLLFGEMYATALAGDGAVGPYDVRLTVGGELGGGATILRLATLHLLNQLLPAALLRQAKLLKLEQPRPDELKFYARVYMGEGVYRIAAYGEDAVRFMRLLAVSAPSASGEYLSGKFNEFMKETQVEVQLDKNSIRRTKRNVAANLTLSEAGVAVKYNVYLRENKVELQFQSTDRGRVELAARLLKRAGVNAEVKKVGSEDVWQVRTTTDKLAAGREELRKALAEIVKTARDNDWVDEKKAEHWLEKLEKGMAAWEEKKFMVRLVEGALVVRFSSTSRESLEEATEEFKAMGLVEGVHFTVRWGGRRGRVYLPAEGVRRLAWVSIHGEEEQKQRAEGFLKFLEARAGAKGGKVLRKLEALLEEGRGRGVLRLVGLERDGVKVLDVKTEEKGDKLYVTLRAEVDGAAGEYKITFYRDRGGARRLMFYVRGEEAVARAVKLVEVLTGERPSVAERPDGLTRIGGAGRHIDALARYEELREAIERWSNR